MAAPKIIAELVGRFGRNKSAYCGSGYNETRLRREFLDPFFEALGWDVDNKRGVSPLYQDVVHEYGTEVEGSQKTADYAFRVGEKVKFFVEAKKPGTRLHDDAGPALQLRRYAYSASLPLSILSDFEEFAAYDGRVPPKKADGASRARLMYFTYQQYVDAWDEIAAVFSKDAVWSGAFDKFAEENRGGKAEPVDKAFLKMLEGWRDQLARNVANRNREKDLDKYELSAAVQSILDRIIFLRVAEDRGIEDRGRLETLQHREGVYAGLMELCLEADDVYNSGLFHFRDEKGRATSRDELTPALHVDDAVLRKILRELNESPYEFGVVPVEILGQVYEQFLGKTIWLDGRGVHIDYKPEVRKAKGVYYTPQYIVDYIVKNTVGELLKGCKNPKDAARLKILDPACGSGSFLLGAYQHLINWHLEWYVADGPEKHEGKVVATPGPGPASWRLTAAAKKDILVQSLYGVDIDPQAVEVTKLSLLLKALEGESRESVGAQTKFLRERILPDLGGNIKCGNSLIGSDYLDVGQTFLSVDEDERRRVNPFDWEVEFGEIMKAGGFDAVIGNPPYGRNFGESEESYITDRFEVYAGVKDIYPCFIEASSGLIRGNGYLSFIVPSAWLGGPAYKTLRDFALQYSLERLVLLPFDVFVDAYVDTCVFILRNSEEEIAKRIVRTLVFGKREKITEIPGEKEYNEIKQEKWLRTDDNKIILEPDKLAVVSKIAQFGHYSFRDVIKVKRGVLFDLSLLAGRRKSKTYYRYFEGDVYRYLINIKTDRWVEFGDNMKERPKEIDWFEGERILLRRLVNRQQRLMACFDKDTYITNKNLYSVKVEEAGISYPFLLGILNSKLISFLYLAQVTQATKDDFPQVTIRDILNLPFPKNIEQTQHDKMVALVEEMLGLHKRLAAAKSDADKQRLQRAIAATDRKIDTLVYELYGLTDEEIRIVEAASDPQ